LAADLESQRQSQNQKQQVEQQSGFAISQTEAQHRQVNGLRDAGDGFLDSGRSFRE